VRLRRRWRARSLAVAVVLAVAAPLAACAASAPEPPPDPGAQSLPAGVAVALIQLRSDVAARQAQVEVHNGTGEPIEIGEVSVTDPRFAGDATRVVDKSSVVRAGGTVDIRIQLPEMACGVEDGASEVALAFLEDGTEAVRTGPLPDTLGFLPRLYERECRAQALADAAAVGISSFEPSSSGVPAALVLEIAPTGDGAAQIAAIQSTNLLTFAGMPAGSFPIGVRVAPGDSVATTVELPLVPLRCDPHAVQEDKRGTVFNLEVEVEGEPGLVQVAASEDMRGRILTWVAHWCGFGAG